MCFLRPKWYTAEALAKCWGVDVDMVKLYNQSGDLKAEVLFQNSEGQDKCWMPEDYTEADWNLLCLEEMIHVGKYYKLEEVKSFEENHPTLKCQTQEKNPSILPDEILHNKEATIDLPGEQLLIGWKAIHRRPTPRTNPTHRLAFCSGSWTRPCTGRRTRAR